jgi:hypothetical protein
MKTLYSFTDENNQEVFASLIGKNENGHYVLEVRGTGAITVRPPDQVTEVLPYTIAVKSGNSNMNTVHIEVPKGSVEKGELVINSAGVIGVVTELDTKNRSATSSRGYRVVETRGLK